LDQALAKHDLTRTDLEQLGRDLLLYNEVQKAVGSDQVTDEDLRSYYEGHQLDYTQFHAEHILVKTKEKAAEIRRKVTPENFQELAKKYSIEPSVQQTGGDLGNQPAVGSLDQTFVEAALSLKPGEIGQPVQTQFGWHIIHLISVEVVPFDRAKSSIRGKLSSAVFTGWLKDRFASAEITINPTYGRFDPATGTVVPVRSTASTSP
jgi:foldase protein PrsA